MTRELVKRKAASMDHSPRKSKTIDGFFKTNNAKKGSYKTKHATEAEQDQDHDQDKPKMWVEWHDIGETWVGHYGTPAPAAKFAAFDLDHTLVTVKGKWRFPKGPDDWQFVHPSVPKVLHSLYDQGYKIVIISNQNGFKLSKKTPGMMPKTARDFRVKISGIAKVLGIPFTILTATAKDYMRKPSPGMWHMAELDNGNVAVDKAASFYVGDAAGRPAGFKKGAPADFSDSDTGFALNVGIPFYTPEEMFHDDNGISEDNAFVLPPPRVWKISRFIPETPASDSSSGHSTLLDTLKEEIQQAQGSGKGLLLVLVGPPACGKSTFAQTHLAPLGFECINMDTLKTRKKCEYAVREALKDGELVVVDNTNPDAEARGSFLELAQTHGARSVAVVFKHSSKDLTLHNNCFRASVEQARHFHSANEQNHDHQTILDSIPIGADRVPAVAYNGYYKRFALPSTSEGFSQILHHVFVPDFASPEEKKIWYQYY
ncbi:DNA kinase/phosphatase Pnk1 [Coemansia sp. RSA 2399]|nr:DNA kinase/phosphatase Pnk1 [Coemansia sp. RSA 2399]KAJ1904952.1 DNA kinase/phosphatase Pnk1 [Coemansia sp. IMI 209127]